MKSGWARLQRAVASSAALGIALLCCVVISGCETLNMPTSRNKSRIANGELKAVLVQVNAKWIDWDSDWSDGKPSISGKLTGKKIVDTFDFLTGSFETAGYLSSHPVLFLSEETMTDGWMVLLLKGNTLYLDVIDSRQGPMTLEDALEDGWISTRELNQRAYYKYVPQWKIHTKQGENLVYAGRLDLTVYKWDLGIFGTTYIHFSEPMFHEEVFNEIPQDTPPELLSRFRVFQDSAEIRVSPGDEKFALSLLKAHFPESGEPVVRLMEKHESGPLIFNEPVD